MDGALQFIAGGIKMTVGIIALIVLGSIITGINIRGQTIQKAAENSMPVAVAHGLVFLLPLLLLYGAVCKRQGVYRRI
jgi:flagellar biosynthesis component FlhA